jgi:hypothetical protein
MTNELIGIISNEGELKGVIEDNSFNVIVQITESGPRGPQGPPGTTTWGGITDKPTNLETVEGSQAKADTAEQNAKDYTDSKLANFEGMVEHGNEYHSVPYATESDLATHIEDDISHGELHGFRLNQDKKLEYFNGIEYVEVKGDKGDTGDKGEQGPQGNDGYTPVKGKDYFDGEKGDKGDKGEQGIQGPKGNDGYTPIRGTDYWTEADQTAIVADVLAALPNGDGVSY